MMEIREAHHIAMLFVKPGMQRQGIGRRLVQEAIAYRRTHNLETRQIAVHSSPNSVAAYERLGFHKTGEQQEANGIRFIPMARRQAIEAEG